MSASSGCNNLSRPKWSPEAWGRFLVYEYPRTVITVSNEVSKDISQLFGCCTYLLHGVVTTADRFLRRKGHVVDGSDLTKSLRGASLYEKDTIGVFMRNGEVRRSKTSLVEFCSQSAGPQGREIGERPLFTGTTGGRRAARPTSHRIQ